MFRDTLWLITEVSIIYPTTKVFPHCANQMNHPGKYAASSNLQEYFDFIKLETTYTKSWELS